MNYIVYDLEATCWEGRPPTVVQEIIEIGAYKINRYAEVVSVFNRFVKPVIHPFLSPFCTRLTSILQEDVDNAYPFPYVIQDFIDWIEVYDSEYLLCSWGDFDRKMLVQDCNYHDLDSEWTAHHLNVKKEYKRFRGLSKAIGLKSAVKREGFEFTGIHHRGIDDAQNLAKIFAKHMDEWQW